MKLIEVAEVIIVLLMAIGVVVMATMAIPLPAIMKNWIAILLFFLLFFGLLRFTVVKEATAKAVVRFGGFKKIVMSWKGYKLDKNWNVKKGKAFRLPGGLRYIGIRWLDKIYKSHFRWYSVELREGEEPKVEFKDIKEMDYILVKPDTYWSKIVKAETKDGMIIDIEFLDTIRSINPWKTFFVAPPNWLENVLNRLNAIRTGWVRSQTFDYIRTLREDPQTLWQELGTDPLIQKTFKNEWGIQIEKNGMQIYKINLQPEYQAALAREKQMELEAKATKVKAEIEAMARSAETVGTVIVMIAQARGKSVRAIKKEIDTNPRRRKEFLNLAKDLIIRKVGIEGRSYRDIRIQVKGAEGIEKTLLNALTLFKIPMERDSKREKRTEKVPEF
ncbi:hypothetical protein AMJ49_00320 [Parcubacteria bacterium DG_74_2]|nr:MAG: hypothetical protein AMJ49_00320 [Parcubacteria bacterium DG_74_2]